MPISLPVDDEANELLTSSALALLIAMLLDQQIPLERAFSAPRDLWARLGHEPTAEELADYNPEALAVKFGEQKAKIFVALLGKQLGVRPPGWREASGVFGADGSYLSVADIVDDESLGKVRSYKQALKAAARDKTAE